MTDPRPRLLLIEDDQQLGPLMREVLDEVYAVTLIDDGAIGVTVALEGTFEVMIVDRRLPGLDGLGVIETLRRKRVTTPMLILTALGTIQDRVRGLDAGANDYLVKPFEFDELFARLRSIRRVYTGEGPFVRIGLGSSTSRAAPSTRRMTDGPSSPTGRTNSSDCSQKTRIAPIRANRSWTRSSAPLTSPALSTPMCTTFAERLMPISSPQCAASTTDWGHREQVWQVSPSG